MRTVSFVQPWQVVAWVLPLVVASLAHAEELGGMPGDVVGYFGAVGSERLLGVAQLSDRSVLVCGGADNLAWLPSSVKPLELQNAAIESGATNQTAFILQLSPNQDRILQVVTLPKGIAADIRCLKTTNAPGQPTGALFISGKRLEDKARNIKAGYFVGRLDGNFVDAPPTRFVWVHNVRAEGDMADTQPWDVGSDGKVVHATGTPHGYDWMAIHRLTAEGQPDVVEDWRLHYYLQGEQRKEWFGTPASLCPHGKVIESAIVLKVWGRGDFRSWTQEDYLAKTPDGNGGVKQGRWPYDAFFAGPFNPADPNQSPRGRGYTGYGWPSTPCGNVGAIAIDRRDNHLYIGGNNKSTLPKNPDFEPFVIAMTATGRQKWWMRLYREVPPADGQTIQDDVDGRLSTPDQYVDGLAIDYSRPASGGALVVLARCHGNNRVNFWNGHEIKHPENPGTSFQPQFTGNNGNIHYSWLGRLATTDGTMLHATYIGEYAADAKVGRESWNDPNLDGWPKFTSAWPDINTTRCRSLRVDLAGNVLLVGTGRRPITTKNAYMKMPKPHEGESRWCDFVRVYSPDLTTLRYSSILAGAWDWKTNVGGSGVSLQAVAPTDGGLLVVGHSTPDAKPGDAGATSLPLRNVPAWGASQPAGESGIFGRLGF
ncbi:MAG: hypothetical protein SFU86_24375 [Pirellulaceae bacterium]|nr:hypothetical protein [Pirellulaceae bacterium]